MRWTAIWVAPLLACGPTKQPDATTEGSSTGPTPDPSTSAAASTTTGPDDTTGTPTPASSSSSSGGADGSTGPGIKLDLGVIPDMPPGDDTTTGALPVDCDAIPPGPLPYTITTGIYATEDFAFDDQGNLVGANAGNLFRSPYGGPPQLWVPGAGVSAGLRATSDGIFVYASGESLSRINMFDAPEVVLGGLSYPNGMDVDLDGWAYVAEQGGNRVRRINPETGEFTVVAEGLTSPNGVSFSPDYSILYVGSFGGGTITAIHLNPDMTTDSVELFYGGIGGGGLDGLAVDACGNVYVDEYGPGIVWRIPPDGSSIEILVNLGAETGWIPNMQFGSGHGGWDPYTLYVITIGGSEVYEVPVEVPDKPRGYP
jgi:SMP-30/Gluconolactonase/LRE-like region